MVIQSRISLIKKGWGLECDDWNKLASIVPKEVAWHWDDALSKKWGAQFKNWTDDLPGDKDPTFPCREYRGAPLPGVTGADTNRIVVNNKTGDVYYIWTRYGDTGNPAFVQIG
ncbi:hypothetical protein [Burkholderia sp. Bp9090]|uniref:hypothetical protein n=1 Tax=Burkholderia sp. Bp9090 TaxID=2184567 RepID=UPI000F5F0914|nr:hypothetical protein [Burkholderia sp. Bp9090]